MNILIVDDDKLFIRKVLEGIAWDEIGIHRVFTAEDMQQACTVLETFSVDIVVTDVEMARGNVLELLSWISEKKYPVETLVVSGYAHFAYVQKAMEYGCKRYLLKPVSGKELSNAIDKIVKQRLRSLPEKKRKFTHNWKELVTGMNNSSSFHDELKNKVTFYDSKDSFRIVVLRILPEQVRGETEQRLLMFVVQNVILEFAEESSFDLECIKQESEEQWSLLLRSTEEIEEVQTELVRIQEYLKDTARITSCFYISKMGNMEEILNNYESFSKFCSEVVFEEYGVISQNKWDLSIENSAIQPCFKQLQGKLDVGDIESVRAELEHFIQSLVEQCNSKKTYFQEFLNEFDKMVHGFIVKNNLNFQQIFDKEQYEAEYQKAIKSVQGMNRFIDYVMNKIDGISEMGDKKKQIVELLKWYISENIGEELTRKRLAQNIHFSEDYIARLFKIETGKSISTYVMEQRMELAKHYIAETNRSISDIAMTVGYNNFSYFSKTFKEYTGKTPNEYRIYVKSSQLQQ